MIIIRNEKFGGTLFNTKNGYLLRVDGEGLQAIMDYLSSKPMNSQALAFLNSIKQKIPLSRHNVAIRLYENIKGDEKFCVLGSPELIDFQVTTACNLTCSYCYANSTRDGFYTPIKDIIYALNQFIEGRVLQIAYGGGEPTLHPNFPRILMETADRGIIPNYTTNGKAIPYDVVKATTDFCGAIAFSVDATRENFTKSKGFPFEILLKHYTTLKELGVLVAFHVVVYRKNLENLVKITEQLLSLEPYGIVFLAYKPAGRASMNDSLLNVRPEYLIQQLDRIMHLDRGKSMIGFDCCFAPALSSLTKKYSIQVYEGCTASRTSMAISPTLGISPCSIVSFSSSFNLTKISLLDAWFSPVFQRFRMTLLTFVDDCATCPQKEVCLGGCPIMPLVPCTYRL